VQALVTAIGGRVNHKTLSFSGKNQDGACLRSAIYRSNIRLRPLQGGTNSKRGKSMEK
jgi:hypothetical protein